MIADAIADDAKWSATITLPPAYTSPSAARSMVNLAFEHWQVNSFDAVLLVSELATNAVVHAGTRFTVQVHATRHWTRVEVIDCSHDPLRRCHPSRRSEHGRGLLLLDRLADRWGWEDIDDGGPIQGCKRVWFELDGVDRNDSDAVMSGFDFDSMESI